VDCYLNRVIIALKTFSTDLNHKKIDGWVNVNGWGGGWMDEWVSVSGRVGERVDGRASGWMGERVGGESLGELLGKWVDE
jgi:hypothetical protein